VNKWRVGAISACGLQKIESSPGIGIEIVERNRGRPVVARLGSGMNDGIWTDGRHQVKDGLTIPDVDLVMGIPGDLTGKALLVPSRIALRAEEDSTLVVINTVDGAALTREEESDFRADEAGGASDDGFHEEKAESENL